MNIVKACGIFIFLILLMLCPQATASSALNALNLWWNNVIPALLPFFIISELLINVGIMNCLSIWLTPIMRPLFKLPGAAALSVVMGFVSGAPTGANIAANLREKGLCSQDEGSRLIAFTNNCSPLFILITIAVATLQKPDLGVWLALSHYPINLIIGIALGFLAPKNLKKENYANISFKTGINALKCCPKVAIGELLANSINNALKNIITIGGFIVFFAVLTAILEEVGFLQLLANCFSPFLNLMGFDPSLNQALAHGFFEMTIGIAELPQSSAGIMQQAVIASIIIAWNGLSIQAQVAAMIYRTDLKTKYYLITRVIHSLVAPLVLIISIPYIPVVSFQSHNTLSWLTPIVLLSFSLLFLILLALASLAWNRKNSRLPN